MAIDLITGHQGVSHISADQIATINNAMMDNFGANKVMRLVGGELTADGLTITISEGYWRVNGFDMEIQEGETLYIDPTTIGLSRIDDIYVEILQDIPTGAQRAEIYIALGEPSATPTAPDEPTAPYLNTDILLQVVPLASVTVTEGAMVMTDLSVAYEMVTPSEISDIVNIYGAKNVVDIAQRYRVGETFAGGLYTINADRTISVNANTASSGSVRLLPNASNELFILPKGDYIFSAEGSTRDYYLIYRIAVGGEEVGNTRNGRICKIHSDGTLGIIILIRKNVNTELTTPLILKPMIRLASIQDDTYEPYAKTNKELTDAFTNQVANSDDTYSPSKAYKVGEHCIYNNVIYKCITACSAAAWSVNQNCFEPTTLTTAVTELNSDLSDLETTINGIGSVVFGTKLTTTVTTNLTNVLSMNLTKGKWLLYSSVRSDGSGTRIFSQGFSGGASYIENGTSGDSASVTSFGVVNLSSTTTVYARFKTESGSRTLSGWGCIAIKIG